MLNFLKIVPVILIATLCVCLYTLKFCESDCCILEYIYSNAMCLKVVCNGKMTWAYILA